MEPFLIIFLPSVFHVMTIFHFYLSTNDTAFASFYFQRIGCNNSIQFWLLVICLMCAVCMHMIHVQRKGSATCSIISYFIFIFVSSSNIIMEFELFQMNEEQREYVCNFIWYMNTIGHGTIDSSIVYASSVHIKSYEKHIMAVCGSCSIYEPNGYFSCNINKSLHHRRHHPHTHAHHINHSPTQKTMNLRFTW